MKEALKQTLRTNPMLPLLALGLFLLPLSNAIGQVPLYLVAVHWGVEALRGRRMPPDRLSLIFLAGFALLILLSIPIASFVAHTDVSRVYSKLNRLLMLPLVFAIPALCGHGEKRLQNLSVLMIAPVLGIVPLALYDFVRIPLEMRDGSPLFHTGNMASPQIYMVAFFLGLALVTDGKLPRGRWLWVCLALALAGIFLHHKRGVWLATSIALLGWTFWSRQWKTLLLMGAIGVLAFSLPNVRTRLLELREVVQPTHGGRMVLWTEVAPRILPEYPWGMGYNVSRHEDFREILPREIHLEQGLRHLHNNFLQNRLELGWQGVIWWTVWMLAVLWKCFRCPRGRARSLGAGVVFAVVALLFNGLVEYNFGTTETFMLYLALFGMLDVLVTKDARCVDPIRP